MGRQRAHLLLTGLFVAGIPGAGILLNIYPSPPPPPLLAIQRGELVDLRLITPVKGEHWLCIRIHENGKLTSAAIRYYSQLAATVDVRQIWTLPRGTSIALRTAQPYWFDRVTASPDVWQIDTSAGPVLTYAQSEQIWRAHRRRGAIVFGGLGAVMFLVFFAVTGLEKRQATRRVWPRSRHQC